MIKHKYILGTALFLIFSGILLLISIALAAGGASVILLTALGAIFISHFLFAAFYIPAYLIFAGIYLCFNSIKKETVYIMLCTIIPFLTTTWAFRLLVLYDGFWWKLLGILLLLLSIFLIYLIILLGLFIFGKNKIKKKIKNKKKELQKQKETRLQEKAAKKEKESKEEKITASPSFFRMVLDKVQKHRQADFSQVDAENQPVVNRTRKSTMGHVQEITAPEPEDTDDSIDVENQAEEEPVPDFELPEPEPELEAAPEPEEELAEDITEEQSEEEFEEDEIPPENADMLPKILPPVRTHSSPKRFKYEIPVENVLDNYKDDKSFVVDDEARESGQILIQTLKEFKIDAEIKGIRKGPAITMFEILPVAGVNVTKISGLAGNIALRLAASRVRIVAPIPGKHAVGVEIPNHERSIVGFKDLISCKNTMYEKAALPFALGRDITGEARIIDLSKTPHLLIAGATGSGKSVCVNTLITSLLYKKRPDEVKMILVDPKIVELKIYNGIPHLLTPVITDPKKALQALQYCICEMERRYALLDALGSRNIVGFNKKIKTNKIATEPLPYIVVIIDEFADLMAISGKELENIIARLTAMSRAVGIHLVLATQRPSVDVITGLIKANIPARIAFMVASKMDSRIIIDSGGADMLLGKGDMLFTSPESPDLVRIQGAFLSDDEVERVVHEAKKMGEPEYIDDEIFIEDEDDPENMNISSGEGGDPLMEKAVEIVSTTGKASASYLQRRLKIGYNRAARLIEDMEARGIVGPQNGSKARDVLHIPDRFKE
ncbi:MAG: DNA translocase FtsK [Spirochaetia bacterium]|nr:DNA translocase FtsK [Spirochaetia bacterium]